MIKNLIGMRSLFYTLQLIGNFLINTLFPIDCLGCGQEGNFLCDDCQATFDVSSFRYCLCREPSRVWSKGKCAKCLGRKLDGLYSALNYQEPRVRQLIHLFKYKPYLKGLAGPLANFIWSHLKILEMQGEQALSAINSFVLMPVPLHKQRQRERGYNQAAELTKELAKKLGKPLLNDCLIKIKKTIPQVKLREKERRENIRGAFLVKNTVKINGQKIVLVDDVYTTGWTMEECAGVLKKAGAEQVWGMVIARG